MRRDNRISSRNFARLGPVRNAQTLANPPCCPCETIAKSTSWLSIFQAQIFSDFSAEICPRWPFWSRMIANHCTAPRKVRMVKGPEDRIARLAQARKREGGLSAPLPKREGGLVAPLPKREGRCSRASSQKGRACSCASSQKGRALTLCHCPEQAPFNAAWSAPNSLMWVLHLRLIEPGERPMIRSTQSPFSVWLRFSALHTITIAGFGPLRIRLCLNRSSRLPVPIRLRASFRSD